MRPQAPALVFAVVAAVMSAACGGDDQRVGDPTGTMSVADQTSTADTVVDATAALEIRPARERIDWLLTLANSGDLDEEALAAGFDTAFLAQVPASAIATVLSQTFGGATNWAVADDTRLGDHDGDVTVTADEGVGVVLTVTVDAQPPHRIIGLYAAPVIPDVVPEGEAASFPLIDAQLVELAPRVSYGLYDVTDGECRLEHGVDPGAVLPIGSAFKLWVLAALAAEVEAGRAAWDEVLPVSDEWKSSPDGEISPLAAGTPRTLREYAQVMIAISDNSATDHLLHRLGRDAVERAMIASGVEDPASNQPLLSTRELFLLKYGDEAIRDDFIAGDEVARRAILDDRLRGVALTDAIDASFVPASPAFVEDVEWYATSADLCRTHIHLADLAARSGLEPVAEILSANPGVPFGERWTDVRFKGGSEPGVAYTAWRLTHRDGRTFVLAGGAVDTGAMIGELRVVATLAAVAQVVE